MYCYTLVLSFLFRPESLCTRPFQVAQIIIGFRLVQVIAITQLILMVRVRVIVKIKV
jgi:hypothetical protein